MRKFPAIFAFATLLLLAAGIATAQSYDPPLRVARLSFAEGDVSFSPAGEGQWYRVDRNRPHGPGDRFWTNNRSRAELQLGAAVVRMDERTSLQILNLDDRYGQFELTQGTLNLHVRRLYQGQTYEIATPTLAFVVSEPGDYRIDVDERGAWTEIVMWEGNAIAYGDRAEFPLRAGDAIRFVEPTLRDYTVFRFPDPDGFDQFALHRNERLENSRALRYVPDDMIGYSDLDEYGNWAQVQDYGNVWFPTQVNAGWAPYRQGNWMWQDPWGWTWVDDAAWGFAPFHYGRWVSVDQRWGWIPSSRRTSAVYAPALVAFLGSGTGYSGSQPVGWFPLGPRDVYLPSYSASRDYFTRVNSGYTTINRAAINNTYISYSTGLQRPQLDYMYRSSRNAVTAVPADVFRNSRPVSAAVLPYERSSTAFSEASHIARMSPTVQSITGAAPRASAVPDRAVESRRVIARTAPPPAAVPFEARRQALGRDPGRPLDRATMETLRGQGRGRAADTASRQVRVVGAGTRVQRPQNEAREATRELERMRDPADDAAGTRAEQDRGGQGRYSRERDPATAQQAPGETGRAAREAQRQAQQQQQAERSREQAEQEQARDQRQEAQRQQRDAEQAARQAQQEREQADRAAGEQRRAGQEAQQAQREQQRQQREAEQAQRAMQQERQQAQDAQREQQRQQREAEQAQRQAQQAQEQGQADAAREQERQAQAAQREQQRQQREAEQAQRQAQQQQQQAERAARAQQDAERQEQAAQREQQRQQREAEQAEQRLQQEQQQAAQQAQRQQQQAAQQAEREQQAAQRQQQQAAQQAAQQAQQQAEAAQREAERQQREAESAQDPAQATEEEDEKGNGKGRYKRGRDGQ